MTIVKIKNPALRWFAGLSLIMITVLLATIVIHYVSIEIALKGFAIFCIFAFIAMAGFGGYQLVKDIGNDFFNP